ncbi:tRNA (adenosine(37)-N6)-threonylcarbamoyltransferase complex ATPase subunit type 1 TsaE [Candidatus Microgenomates bacterium]|nr:tRNA (adenosine(37)-N6)-threonylcarbamoyltransferase complex ATPase subunit type 1 TsaE [Candidatus Microgenomates bacterium]
MRGGEVIELIGDLGSGKTQLVRGLAKGISSRDQVQSPSFTIARVYRGKKDINIHHFDFHRLKDPGVVAQELVEVIGQPKTVTVIEWSDPVKEVLPRQRLRIEFMITGAKSRLIRFTANNQRYKRLIRDLLAFNKHL